MSLNSSENAHPTGTVKKMVANSKIMYNDAPFLMYNSHLLVSNCCAYQMAQTCCY